MFWKITKQFTTPFLTDHLKNKIMEIKYFKNTDTLYIVFNKNKISQTIDISENILAELDENNKIVSITLEHAKSQTNISNFSVNMQPEIIDKIEELV